MKATVIAIDFVKDTDGTFKALELNTNVLFHPMQSNAYLDTSKITDFITANNISSFEYIGTSAFGNTPESINVKDLEGPADQDHTTDFGPRALAEIKTVVSASIDYNDNLVQYTATTVPYLEDADDTLLFRNAYDSTAVIDSNYASTSLGFLEFLHLNATGDNAVSIPNTFIAPSGSEGQTYGDVIGLEPVIDTIDNSQLRDNGAHPNYIIKLAESSISSDYSNFPKLLKITSADDMQSLKESLDGTVILQEYVLNLDDLVDGKAKTYRMTAAIAGADLEVLDFYEPYFASNRLALPASPDFDGDKVQKWERPAYVQKMNGATEPSVKFLTGTKFKQSEGEVTFGNVGVGNNISSFNLTGLNLDEEDVNIQEWSGSYDGSFPGSIVNAQVEDKTISDAELFNLVYVIKYDGGALETTDEAWISTVADGKVTFKKVFELGAGDELLEASGVKVITDIKTKIVLDKGGSLDIEEVDVAAVKGTDGSVFGIHNKIILCNCYNCYGYAAGASPCIQGPGCYYSPGCSSSYPYCSSYMQTTYQGCENGQK